MRIVGIYKIESKVHPDRIYIGSSKHCNRRMQDHWYSLRKHIHKNPKLQCHYNKHGLEDLVFSVVEECALDKLIEREQFYLDSMSPWFNIIALADRPPRSFGHIPWNKGKKMTQPPWNKGLKGIYLGWSKGLTKDTDARVMQISLSNKGRVISDEHKKILSEVNKGNKNCVGHVHTEETRRKISLAHKGVPESEETKKKLSAVRTGHPTSEATREKLRKAHTGKKMSKEACEKMSKYWSGRAKPWLAGKETSLSTREKLSIANKGKLPPNTGKPCSAEHKQKISIANKGTKAVYTITTRKRHQVPIIFKPVDIILPNPH